jgi:hypothetical protein
MCKYVADGEQILIQFCSDRKINLDSDSFILYKGENNSSFTPH